MTEENPYLRDLNLPPLVQESLEAHGFKTLDDLQKLTNAEILRMPNVGGLRLMKALGRDFGIKKERNG